MTISAHIIDNQKIKQIDDFLSNVASLKKELKEQQAASFWVHVDDLADVFRLQDIFGIHPLAIDAVIHQNHPSKVEEYDAYLFTIIDGVRIEEKAEFSEDDLYIFLGKRWIITINFYNNQLAENFYILPNCRNIDSQLDKMEEAILDKPLKSHLSEILVIRRKTSFLESTLEMILRVINQIIDDQQTKLSNDAKKQIRSLYDRLSYLRNNLENQHNRVIILREAYNSSLTATLNETIRTLTVIATIVLPLTLIAGIYGMNFDVMPELQWAYGYYYALALMAAVGVCLISYFRIKRWI